MGVTPCSLPGLGCRVWAVGQGELAAPAVTLVRLDGHDNSARAPRYNDEPLTALQTTAELMKCDFAETLRHSDSMNSGTTSERGR
jgi:hypothetical protein